MYQLCVLIVLFLAAGCSTRSDLAPVVELKWQAQNVHQTTHRVKRGETLYSVAFHYDLDYRQLAAINHLQSPYAIRVGQVLEIKAGAPKRFVARSRVASRYVPQRKTPQYYLAPKKRELAASMYGQWLWPVNGRITARFVPQQGKKGIDIAGKKGEKIHAASSGVVAYAGSGLSSYGNLIIIKHNNQYLTAYGNNSHNMVKEGQKVKAGQIIAEIGVIDRNYWGVHFEIRKDGKPVNPLDYLKKG